jgi:flagellar hook-basal body complex protein FliE
MPDPLSIQNALQTGGVGPTQGNAPGAQSQSPEGPSFRDTLLDSLSEVNRLQQEAADGVQAVLTGQSDNVAEVLSAVRKADVAFSMLMETRNKLVEAYQELQQMRV